MLETYQEHINLRCTVNF